MTSLKSMCDHRITPRNIRSHQFFRRVSRLASGEISFGVIPHDHWYQPDWIDENKAREGRERLEAEGVIYGG